MKLGEVARNPLGIIGLFISLIYGFANWMLGSTATTLASSERVIIIWFIVLFPVLILVAFCYLVVNHHGKLYAPKDYNKDESFLQTLNQFDSFVRLTNETLESSQERLAEMGETSRKSDETYDRDTEMPTRASNQETPTGSPREPVYDLMEPMDDSISSSDLEKVFSTESAAEGLRIPAAGLIVENKNDLDLIEYAKKQKQISRMKELFELTQFFIKTDQRFIGFEVMSNVKMGDTGVVYDAAAFTDAGLQCLEVKYVRSKTSFRNLLIKFASQANAVQLAALPADFNLRLVFVHDWDQAFERELKSILSSMRPMLPDFIRVELIARPTISI